MSTPRDEMPQRIGRYEIAALVGFGATGAVYKAFDPLIRRTVAIKTLRLDVPPGSPQYRSFLERFHNEVQISGALSHPNIVTLYDIGETDDGLPFLAMEFVDGETVAELLEKGARLRPEQVVALISQVASAIDYAHSQGVIHRDIKPSNLIVYDGEKIKVTDFGIAKLMDAEITQTGTLLGTPSYMSPEQAMGETLDGRTDIFSLGVVAFEMLSGQQPFPGNNVTSILYKLVHAEPVRPDNLEVLGLLPDQWHAVFSRVLAKDPNERYPTAAEFVTDLEKCLGSWFGSLEGETVILSPQEAGAARDAAEEERTVLLSAEEIGRDAGGAEGEDRTVLLPAPDAADAGDATLVAPAEETAAPGGPRENDERTIAVSAEELRAAQEAAVADRTATMAGPAAGATGGDATVTAAVAARGPGGTQPIRLRRSRLALFAGGGLLALALGGGALAFVLLRGAGTASVEEIALPPPPRPLEPAPAAAAADAGRLAIRSEPDGAAVYVDGQPRGVTPLEIAGLPLGVYLVRLEKEGYRAEELAAVLEPERPAASLAVALEPERQASPRAAPPRPARGTIEISDLPDGARVLVDGEPVAAEALPRIVASPGRHVVRVEKDGFEPFERTVDVRGGATVGLAVALRPVETAEAPEPSGPSVRPGELVELGPDVTRPECIECPGVPYPEVARRARLEGLVEVSYIINENGTVEDIRIVESAAEVFNEAVIEALRRYRYKPATKQGVPVKVRWQQRFRFRRGR